MPFRKAGAGAQVKQLLEKKIHLLTRGRKSTENHVFSYTKLAFSYTKLAALKLKLFSLTLRFFSLTLSLFSRALTIFYFLEFDFLLRKFLFYFRAVIGFSCANYCLASTLVNCLCAG